MFDIDALKPQVNQNGSYTPSKEDQIIYDYVDKHCTIMRNNRKSIDENREIYYQALEAKNKPYGDERSTSSVQLADALVENYVAEAIRIQTDYLFKADTTEHSTAAKTIEHAWKDDWRKNNRKKVMIADEYNCSWIGNSVIYTGFEMFTKEQSILDEKTGRWMLQTVEKEQIVVENVDIRGFYLDSEAIIGIDDAMRCYYDQRLSYDRFITLSNNKHYKNIEYVKPRGYSNEHKRFVTREEVAKRGDFVHVRSYRDLDKDMFVVLANGIVVRAHPIVSMINGEKALPFSFRSFGYKQNSIYGKGFCEACLYFQSDINKLREMCMDAILRSNSSVLAIGPGISFTERGFAYGNEVLAFDGENFDQNFKQISGTPPNAAIFNYMDRLYKDIAVYVGVDVNNIMGTPNRTAFEVDVQREASQKRMNLWFVNRDLANERFANLHVENIKKYYAREKDGKYPKVEIEGEAYIDGRYKTKKGKNIVEIRPEMMIGDTHVDVYTNTNAATINAVERQRKMDFFTALPGIINTYALSEQTGTPLKNILPLDTTIRGLAEDNNIETFKLGDKADLEAQKADFVNSLKNMIPGAQQQQAPQQIPQQQAPQQQPLPSNI